MDTKINITEKVKLRSPILIEGLPGIGNVGRVAAGYLVSEMKMKKFAELYSQHFLPLVILHEDSVANLLKCEFYYYKGKKNDIIVLTGDTQSISPEGHYDVCDCILDFAEKLGVKEIITLGGFAESQEVKEPRVIGAVNNKKLMKKYDDYGIDFKEKSVGTVVGASGLLLGLGAARGMGGLCLMGETLGLPLITDPRAADKVLQVLTKILDIKLDLSKLETIVNEMEEKIKKAETIHKKVLREFPKTKEDIRYIG
jgi:uncharacterized protein (TIGR00162 family)